MAGKGKLTIETSNAFIDESYSQQNADVPVGHYVQISVSDTGSGMSRELQEKAFDPFFTTKEPGQGTGLGLSQVYGFVKQSGGHVKIYSTVGEGTTVKIYLPRAWCNRPAQGERRPCGREPGKRSHPRGRG
jgi:signal transduction histidine kinase